MMTTMELIRAEIDRIPEERLGELYGLVREFATSRGTAPNRGIMGKLRGVQIDAPADFAANLDLYVSGEKCVDGDLH